MPRIAMAHAEPGMMTVSCDYKIQKMKYLPNGMVQIWWAHVGSGRPLASTPHTYSKDYVWPTASEVPS